MWWAPMGGSYGQWHWPVILFLLRSETLSTEVEVCSPQPRSPPERWLNRVPFSSFHKKNTCLTVNTLSWITTPTSGRVSESCRRPSTHEASGGYALALGLGSMFNHNKEPNVGYMRDKEKGFIVYTTLREIAVGEELTIHYGSNLWFETSHQSSSSDDEDPFGRFEL